MSKPRASRNKTMTLNAEEQRRYKRRLRQLDQPVSIENVLDCTICQDVFEVLDWLPGQSVDLLFADPPYNMYKTFNGRSFTRRSSTDYAQWLDAWVGKLVRVLKPSGSVYLCGDWRSGVVLQQVAARYFTLRNRITWEREKGRGAKTNWKNVAEDIWFCTCSDAYTFNIDAVKIKRQVRAPYTTTEGVPKDWEHRTNGKYRLTHPSNVWTDLTVPFWSMSENTDHPTQKPEKLLAKIILASSNPGDVVLDPFLGSGTTSVVAKKLDRRYIGIEIDEMYACLAEKRLECAETDRRIQGYADQVFWERNARRH